jgi:hypothetical protein
MGKMQRGLNPAPQMCSMLWRYAWTQILQMI